MMAPMATVVMVTLVGPVGNSNPAARSAARSATAMAIPAPIPAAEARVPTTNASPSTKRTS